MPAMTMPLPGSLTRFTNPQTVAASSNTRAVPSNGIPCHLRNDISSIPRIICSGDIEPSVHGLLNRLRIVASAKPYTFELFPNGENLVIRIFHRQALEIVETHLPGQFARQLFADHRTQALGAMR